MELVTIVSRLFIARQWALMLCLLSSVVSAITNHTLIAGGANITDIYAADAANVKSVASTVLIIGRVANETAAAYLGLQGYGIPYEVLLVPSGGVTLPDLTDSTGAGSYGSIVVINDVTYQYSNGWGSAITDVQWQQLYDYQTAYSVRMVRLDVFPGAEFGTTTAVSGAGCCDSGVEQYMYLTNNTGFTTAGLKLNANVSTTGLYHYPATITDPKTTFQVAKFGTSGQFKSESTAAVINVLPNGNGVRQQMVWFTGFAPEWSLTSNYAQHAWIHWITRGLYSGYRRVLFNTQIDDVHLETEMYSNGIDYEPTQANFRLKSDDLDTHVTWMTSINKKMPKGSSYIIELGHNGNGNIEAAAELEDSAFFGTTGDCSPNTGIEYFQDDDNPGPLEYQKPVGSGTDLWPATPTSYGWSLDCVQVDDLATWFMDEDNLNRYAHISHTFTHEDLMNATYADADREISWNQAWLKQVGISSAKIFSADGLIPPAITGLHNGDAIKAFLKNGIKYVVGDNTRPALMNQVNAFWPLWSTVANNGYDGLAIIPRWATLIYYNCDVPACTTAEWIHTSAGKGNFDDLLLSSKATNMQHLLGLHHDPFMFHQANLRVSDVATTKFKGKNQQLSLLQMFVEDLVAEYTRLVDWPMVTIKHSEVALDFINREIRDKCNPQLRWNYSSGGKTIVGATLTATGNTCGAEIPVTFPGPVVSTNGGRSEQLGSDPLTVWVKLAGSPVTFNLKTPIAL